MENKIDSSYKLTLPDNSKIFANINGEQALQMLNEGKINTESMKQTEKGIVAFQDKLGNSYRSELSKEQIAIFKPNPSENLPGTLGKEKLLLASNAKEPSCKPFISMFDEHSNTLHSEQEVKPIELSAKNTSDNKWNFKFYFGYNRTKYADTDMHLKSSRMDVTVKDFSFKERTSSDFYNPKNWEGAQDSFRWIDEPTNSFTLNAENKNNVFYLTAFHPKFLKETYQDKHVMGTIDGVSVDKVMPINEPFDGYNSQPGEMNLTRFENTHKQMDWQVGYGRNVTLIDGGKKYGKLVYTPSVYAGVTSGKHFDSYVKPNQYWDFNNAEDKNKIQGLNFAVGNRLKYEYGKASVFVENKTTVSHLKNQFQDGTAEFNMLYNATTFGVGFNLYETKPKPNKLDKND